jgi:dihydrofolate synthase/folylpolyglutamate synthase
MTILEEFFPLKRLLITPGSERLVKLMNCEEGHAALGIRCALVVGTNGKGSTARMIEHELQRQGFFVGTYCSPHFVDPLERIRIGCKNADVELVSRAKETTKLLVTKNLPDATFFEITTAIALFCFHRAKVDFAVIEAGLGARFDSTNAMAPLVTVLTSVGLDHVNILGSDEESIAFDKSFGSRRNRPFVCGYLSTAALKGVNRALEITGAQYVDASDFQEAQDEPDFLAPKERNALTAFVALTFIKNEIPFSKQFEKQEVLERLRTLQIPGRFDIRTLAKSYENLPARFAKRPIVLDNGHNPHAIKALLREYKNSDFSNMKYNLIFGALKEKDYQTGFSLLEKQAETITVCVFSHEESLQRADITKFCSANICTIDELQKIILTNFERNDLPHLITGSFAFIGEVMKELKIFPESR